MVCATGTAMRIIDYNGTGRWSREEILRRYREYSEQFQVSPPADLTPQEVVGDDTRWIYPVMHKVIEGIAAGDRACVQLGVELIQSDEKFTFGKSLKAGTARNLRRAPLTQDQQELIRARVIGLLLAGHIPHEYREYARLLRRVGIGRWWHGVEERVDRNNFYVMRFYEYFRRHVVEVGR
jgi:hypothetical protein